MRPRLLVLTFALPAALVACHEDISAPTAGFALAPLSQSDLWASGRASHGGIAVDFEEFQFGAIDGQFDWKSLGGTGALPSADPAATHCAVYDHVIANNGTSGSAYRVRSFGARSLRISNAVTSGCYGDQTFSSRSKNAAGETGSWVTSKNGLVNYLLPQGKVKNHFEAEWSFASTVPLSQQTGLQVVVSPARGDDARMSWVQLSDLSDGLAVDFAERSNPASAGDILVSPVARRLDRRTAHTIRLTIDFVDGASNDIVRVYVDGELRHTGTSWENYYHYDPRGLSNFGGQTPAVNRLMFRTGSDARRGLPGTAAPATAGHGFVIDDITVAAFHVGNSEHQQDQRDR